LTTDLSRQRQNLKRPCCGHGFCCSGSRLFLCCLYTWLSVCIFLHFFDIRTDQSLPVYGTLYLLFAAFPIVFEDVRGWSEGIGGLSFLGVAAGILIGVAYTFYDNKRYRKASEAAGGNAPPEARLPPAIIGGICLPIGLFWYVLTRPPLSLLEALYHNPVTEILTIELLQVRMDVLHIHPLVCSYNRQCLLRDRHSSRFPIDYELPRRRICHLCCFGPCSKRRAAFFFWFHIPSFHCVSHLQFHKVTRR
jgi:hypothetical protein